MGGASPFLGQAKRGDPTHSCVSSMAVQLLNQPLCWGEGMRCCMWLNSPGDALRHLRATGTQFHPRWWLAASTGQERGGWWSGLVGPGHHGTTTGCTPQVHRGSSHNSAALHTSWLPRGCGCGVATSLLPWQTGRLSEGNSGSSLSRRCRTAGWVGVPTRQKACQGALLLHPIEMC